MTEGPQEFFRIALKDFKAADALLSSQLKRYEDTASAERSEVKRKAGVAEGIATDCWEQIEGQAAYRADFPVTNISSKIASELQTLKNWSADIQADRQALNQINTQLCTLQAELKEALEKEEAERLKEEAERVKKHAGCVSFVMSCIVFAVVLVCILIALHLWLLQRTTLAFTISVDGQPTPPGMAQITLDGASFASFEKIKPGHHRLSIESKDTEPFKKDFWTFYGNNDLGALPLEFSKGSLFVAVNPSPAKVILQRGNEELHQGDSPLTVPKLSVGSYVLRIRRGEYEEKYSVEINRQRNTEVKVDLNLGTAKLTSTPPDAEFELTGKERTWKGTLPTEIKDVPAGIYELKTKRKGWEIGRSVVVSRGNVSDVSVEFGYASIILTSEPSGLTVFANSVEIGKTPATVQELMPGGYTVTATDGENDLSAEIRVRTNEVARHAFIFRYGTVGLSSTPAGATVIRKRRDVGKTPLTLERIPAEGTTIELRLEGYVSTNMPIVAQEGAKTNYTIKLFSRRYVDAMEDARHALAMAESEQSSDRDPFGQARKSVVAALQIDSADGEALALQAEIIEKTGRWKKQKEKAEQIASEVTAKRQVDELTRLTPLNPEDIIKICWNTSSSSCSGNSSDQFSGLSAVDAAKSNPAAVPVAAATDVVVKGIEGIAWSVRKLGSIGKSGPTKARFDYERFNLYQNTWHRYYGKIANIDGKAVSVTFAPDGKSKQSYEVVARFVGKIPPTVASMPQGSPLWVSGKLTTIQEIPKSNSSAANRIILDDCTAYPATTLPPDN